MKSLNTIIWYIKKITGGRRRNCRIGSSVIFDLGNQNNRIGRIIYGSSCTFSQGVILRAWGGSIEIGTNVFMGEYSVIYGHGNVIIGDDTLISMHCRILSSNHEIPNRDQRIRYRPDILLPTSIGKDVWLGAGVTVLGGVKIGDGCVVGAGAVVANDLPPYSIAVGVPAKIIKERN